MKRTIHPIGLKVWIPSLALQFTAKFNLLLSVKCKIKVKANTSKTMLKNSALSPRRSTINIFQLCFFRPLWKLWQFIKAIPLHHMAEIASLGWTPKFSYTYTVSYKMAHLKNELFYGQVQIVSISSTWLSIKVISVSYRIQVLLKTCARYLTMCSWQLLKLLHSFFTRKVTWSLAKLEWPRCERTSKLLANRKRKSL